MYICQINNPYSYTLTRYSALYATGLDKAGNATGETLGVDEINSGFFVVGRRRPLERRVF